MERQWLCLVLAFCGRSQGSRYATAMRLWQPGRRFELTHGRVVTRCRLSGREGILVNERNGLARERETVGEVAPGLGWRSTKRSLVFLGAAVVPVVIPSGKGKSTEEGPSTEQKSNDFCPCFSREGNQTGTLGSPEGKDVAGREGFYGLHWTCRSLALAAAQVWCVSSVVRS